MSDSVWMRDAAGVYALVPAGDRDTWVVRGLAEADEPTSDATFVHMAHHDLDGQAVIPWGAREYFTGRGFHFSAPPEPVDVTKDPQLGDVPPATKAVPKKAAAKASPDTTKEQ